MTHLLEAKAMLGRGFLIGLLCLSVSLVQGADWPVFRGSALQTGVSTSKLPDQLEVRWKFQTNDAVEGTAAIVGDTVYIGSLDGYLYALDLASGKEKWKYKAGPVRVSISVKDGAVYAGNEDGVFHCLNAATGEKRWTFETEAEITSAANFARDAVLFGSGDETLYCLSKEGKVRWKFKVPGGPVMGSPAVVGDRTFVAGCDSSLHLLGAAKGKETAAIDLGGQVAASIAVVGDQLYIATMSNQVLGVDYQKGQILWRFEDRRQQPFFASPAVKGDLVVAGCRDKRVYALNRKTGQEVWNFATKGKVDSSPVVAGERVYAASQDGHLYVLDLNKGTLVQTLELGKAVTASPAVGGNCLVIGTREGVVYCLAANK